MCKVGLGSDTTAEFLAKARNIVTQHRELQNQVEALNSQISHLEMTQLRAVGIFGRIFCMCYCAVQCIHLVESSGL